MKITNIWKQNLHLEPEKGWLNDPNGLVYFNSTYYIYHQYSYEAKGAKKYWYAYSSKDLINYIDNGVVLSPDNELDISGSYSGSANIENDEMVFYYTGNVKKVGNYDFVHNGRISNTIKFKSKDGINFTKKELLFTNEDYPNMSNHVRDPKIFEKNDNKYLILGARDKFDYGCLLVYRNDEYFKTIYSEKNLGYMWECPDYFALDKKEIFIFSPQGISYTYPNYVNKYQVGYSVINEEIENVEKIDNFKLLDYGHDFYAPQTFIDEDNERVMIAWMYVPDSSYTNPTLEFDYQNCLSIPRVLKFENDKLVQKIHKSVYKLFANKIENDEFSKNTFYFSKKETGDFKISIDKLEIKYTNEKLEISLNETSYGRDNRSFDILIDNIEIVFDSSSFEIFINNGEFTFSSRYYPKNHNVKIEAKNYEIYEIDSIKINKR